VKKVIIFLIFCLTSCISLGELYQFQGMKTKVTLQFYYDLPNVPPWDIFSPSFYDSNSDILVDINQQQNSIETKNYFANNIEGNLSNSLVYTRPERNYRLEFELTSFSLDYEMNFNALTINSNSTINWPDTWLTRGTAKVSLTGNLSLDGSVLPVSITDYSLSSPWMSNESNGFSSNLIHDNDNTLCMAFPELKFYGSTYQSKSPNYLQLGLVSNPYGYTRFELVSISLESLTKDMLKGTMVIPESATLSLFALGAIVLRRKK